MVIRNECGVVADCLGQTKSCSMTLVLACSFDGEEPLVFLVCDRPRVVKRGQLSNGWDAVGNDVQLQSYCNLISMSSTISFTQLHGSLCKTQFLWSHCWQACIFEYEAYKVGSLGGDRGQFFWLV